MMPIIKIKKKKYVMARHEMELFKYFELYSLILLFISLMYSHYMNLIFPEQVLKLNTICILYMKSPQRIQHQND